jgi:sugar lactone lactonase YvrE
MTEIVCATETRDALGESCLWCPTTRKVWWLDVLKPSFQSYDPATRAHQVYPLPGPNCGCVALRKAGGFVLAMPDGLHSYDPQTGALSLLVDAEPGRPHNRYNDGRCDRRGRFWIGTMHTEIKEPSGSFYRIGTDHSVERLFGGISVPNSTAFSPDDRTLYFADSWQRAIWAFDFDIDAGAISNHRVFVDFKSRQGAPDGSCIDAEGFLWNAEFGGQCVARYAPDGRLDRTIGLPVKNPTCCCFGGPGLATLYVTTSTHRHSPEQRAAEPLSGGLLALHVGMRGLPEAAFGG